MRLALSVLAAAVTLLLPQSTVALECYDGYRLLATGSVGTTTTQCSGWNDFCYNMTASAGFLIDAVKGGCSTWRCMLARNTCIGTTFQGVPVSLCCCSGDRCNIGSNSGRGGGNSNSNNGGGGGWGSNSNNNNNGGGGNNHNNNNNNGGGGGGWGSDNNNNNNNNNRGNGEEPAHSVSSSGGWGSEGNGGGRSSGSGSGSGSGAGSGWGSERGGGGDAEVGSSSTGGGGGSSGGGGWGSETPAAMKRQQIQEAFNRGGNIDDGAPRNRGKRLAEPAL